jgi:hypothetical protein
MLVYVRMFLFKLLIIVLYELTLLCWKCLKMIICLLFLGDLFLTLQGLLLIAITLCLDALNWGMELEFGAK